MRLYADTDEARAWVGVLCENHVLFADHEGTLGGPVWSKRNNRRRNSTGLVALWNRLDRLVVRIGAAAAVARYPYARDSEESR